MQYNAKDPFVSFLILVPFAGVLPCEVRGGPCCYVAEIPTMDLMIGEGATPDEAAKDLCAKFGTGCELHRG